MAKATGGETNGRQGEEWKSRGRAWYERVLDIDKHRLDEELNDQPKLAFQAEADLADARLAMDEAKAEMEVVRAEFELAVRTDPERYGLPGKATEAGVACVVAAASPVRDALAAYHRAKHAAAIHQAGVSGVDGRKRSLEKIVELFFASYFASPRIPEGDREGVRDVERRRVRRSGGRAET